MIKRSPFPWSNDQIQKATRARAIPVYDEDEIRIRNDLALEAAHYVMSRRAGATALRHQQARGEVRRIVLVEAFRTLSDDLRRTPTGVDTVWRLRDVLAENYAIDVSVETIRKDIRKIGAKSLR